MFDNVLSKLDLDSHGRFSLPENRIREGITVDYVVEISCLGFTRAIPVLWFIYIHVT